MPSSGLLTHGQRVTRYAVIMDIGHRIKHARMSAGLSQSELATHVGVSRGLVGQWENHTKRPGRDNVTKLAQALSVSVGYILGSEALDASAIVVTDPDEAALLRRYRTLSDRQRRSIHDLVGIAGGLPFLEAEELEPTH